jgi:myosin heavy subunit
MQLNAAGRRECVEDFLDIKVFSTMALMARERLRTIREQQNIKEAEYSALCFKIDTLEDKIKEMSQRDDAELDKYEKQIRDNEVKVLECEERLKTWYKDVVVLTEEIDDTERLGAEKQVKQLNNVLIRMNTKLERLAKEKEFYDTNGSCHTCNQPIGYEHAEIQKGELQKEIEQIDEASVQASEMMVKQQTVVDRLFELNQQMRTFNQEVFKLQTQLKSHQDEISSCQKYINTLKEMSNDTEKEQATLHSFQDELKRVEKQRVEMKESISNHEVVVGLLKDSGIKTQIVKKYLPAMNRFIRHYLNELDFPVHFQIDSEFNETVSSPLHQDFSYQSFSEGQKGRIDLALMFTWREIGRLKNSVTTNLLILDEVFSSSLDETGKECLLQLLRYRLPDDQRIVVVDHTLSSSFKDKFDSSVEVTRKGGFSRYE